MHICRSEKFSVHWSPAPWDGDVDDSRYMSLFHMCYPAKFVALSQTLWVWVGISKNLGMGVGDPLQTPYPHVLPCQIWSLYVTWYLRTYGVPLEKYVPPFVIRTKKDQLGTYDFILMICSNHGPISNRFRNKLQFWPKTAQFLHHKYITLCWGVPFELCNGVEAKQN